MRAACWLWFAFWWTALLFLMAAFALVFGPRRGGATHAVARLWARGLLGAAGVGVTLEGAEHLAPGEPRLLVANHASYLDPPALLAAFPGPARFVLKRELLRLPFIGWFAWFAGHFLIDRSRARSGARLLEGAARRARALGLSPIVFPEGTRSADGRLAPLKAGAFELALTAGLPVQPVALRGTFELMPRGALAPRRAGDVRVRVAPALPARADGGSAARRALAEQAAEALGALGVPRVG